MLSSNWLSIEQFCHKEQRLHCYLGAFPCDHIHPCSGVMFLLTHAVIVNYCVIIINVEHKRA